MSLQSIIDAPSRSKSKAKAMGFEYTGADLEFDGTKLIITGKFKCVCDKVENFKFTVDLAQLDPASLLEAHGAFSAEHLKQDGYSDEQIEAILSAGRNFGDTE